MSYQQNMGMQSPWGNTQGGSSNYGGQNYNQGQQGGFGGDPFMNSAISGMIHNKDFQRAGVNYIENELAKRLGQTRSFNEYFFTPRVKSYFDIDNKYVLKKLLKIMFPFTKAGQESSYDTYETNYGYGGNAEEQKSKRLMAPDLYIPLMSFMTFILMVCLHRGIGQEFKPDLISYYTFNCVIFGFLEILLYKFIFVVVSIKTLTIFDIMAFLNYKFVGLCVILASTFVIGGWLSLVLKIYFSLSFVYYMYIELRSHAQGVAEVDIGRASLKSDTIVYFLSGLQFLTMWLLVFTMI